MRENPKCVVTAHAQRNDEQDGLEIFFSGRPPQDILRQLKDRDWIFAPGQNPVYWFKREPTEDDVKLAEEIAGAFDDGQDLDDPKPESSGLERKGVARQISVTQEGDALYVQSPYNEDFNEWVKGRNATWDRSRGWKLDARDEEAVREKLMDIYGTDGRAVEMVDVRYDTAQGWGFDGDQQVFMMGRSILRKKHRDRKPMLGDGVVILQGALKEHGGSMKYPEIKHTDNLILEIRDVPRSLAEPFVERRDEATIVRENPMQQRKTKNATPLLVLGGIALASLFALTD